MKILRFPNEESLNRKLYYDFKEFENREEVEMVGDILVEKYIDSITMPENLKIGLMIAEQRKKCAKVQCPLDEYYGFAFGQSPFHVPEPIAKALCQNAHKGHYSDAEGIPKLREAIAGFNKRHFDLDVDPSCIFVGPGTKELIHFIFNVIKGGIIVPSPSWIGYFPLVKLEQKDFHKFYLKPENDYKIQPDDLDRYLSRLRGAQHMIVINNPHNPTGAVYSEQELKNIADVCRAHNTLVLSDEIYALTTYEFEKFTSMGKVYPEGAFVTNGLSKDRSAGGYRLGSCILPENSSEKLIQDFKKVAATVYTNVSTPIQFAAITAYEPNEEIEEYFKITRDIHRMIGQYLSAKFNEIDVIKATIPHGGFYFFVDFNELGPDLTKEGVVKSNDLATSLISHPFHFAAVTGDSVLLKEDDFGARIAFVDYDGKKAFQNYKENLPKTKSQEIEFVNNNSTRMVRGVKALRDWAAHIKKTE